jgi:hypothetical protein
MEVCDGCVAEMIDLGKIGPVGDRYYGLINEALLPSFRALFERWKPKELVLKLRKRLGKRLLEELTLHVATIEAAYEFPERGWAFVEELLKELPRHELAEPVVPESLLYLCRVAPLQSHS